jgi:hypothetical protein
MNRVLGHLQDNQLTLLTTLGGEPPFDPEQLARYRRESQLITSEGPGVLGLEQLLAGHDQLHAAITARLAGLSEADFDREIQLCERRMRLGWRVYFLQFHSTYHLGQLELLRQPAGKTDKLI